MTTELGGLVDAPPAPTEIQVPGVARRPLGPPRRRYAEQAGKAVLLLAALVSIVTTVGIVVALLGPTIEFFTDVSVGEFVTNPEWAPLFEPPRFGVRPLITATFIITTIAMLTCVPFGIGAAVYLGEYASPRKRKFLKPAIELLAGVPTVVYGFFALTFVTPLLQDIWPFAEKPQVFNGLAAGLVMGVMLVPTIASLSEDAMAALPASLRQGAYALGASRFQVVCRVTIPSALSGIVASMVLAFSRAIGETMIVLVAAGGTPTNALNPVRAMQTMTAFIASAGLGDQPTGSTGYKTIFAVGSTLFLITLAVNLVSIRIVRRYRQEYE